MDGSASERERGRENTTEREKLPLFPVLTVQCFLTARESTEGERERVGRRAGREEEWMNGGEGDYERRRRRGNSLYSSPNSLAVPNLN